MTKKHFIALADTMRLPGHMSQRISDAIHRAQYAIDPANEVEIPQLTDDQAKRLNTLVMDAIAWELADFCGEQNSRFDRHRWLGYIKEENGPNGGKR